MESYRTLSRRSTASLVEKKSEFIGVAAPATSEEEALAVLESIRAEHRTARHHVYAYNLQKDARQRYSDDGEPAKTAGLPVLGVITHADITDCIVVVTRYFGGTLLGTGGLVRAYTGAAQAALAANEILTVRSCVTLDIKAEYPLFEQIQRILQEAGARLQAPVFTHEVAITATMPAGDELAVLAKLNELCRGSARVEVSPPFYLPF